MVGEPSHFELGAPDAGRAQAFYRELFGWSFTPTTGENAWIETPGVRGGLHDEDDAKNIDRVLRRDRHRGGRSAGA